MGVNVLKPGLLTTVQDLGRYGYQQQGIIVSGAMDTLSMRLANLLVGNSDNEPVLEITMIGPTLTFSVDTIIAVCGGNLSPTINKQPISLNKPILVKKGDCLEFGKIVTGCRSYISFFGGIQVEPVLASKSTCLSAGFGGFQGRPLRKGDVLPVNSSSKLEDKLRWKLSNHFISNLFPSSAIRFIKGRQYDLFRKECINKFVTDSFTLTKDANRMGYRLEGPMLNLNIQQEILTEGVTFGSVQVPSNGQPIILMADRQTTGGYPKIAQVISIDLPRLAQLKPGDTIQFAEVSLKDSQQLALCRENELRALRKIFSKKWKVSGLSC
jgi:antagonist of KipI